MNEKVLYYSQNGRHKVAGVNHPGANGALVTINDNQAHQIVSVIRRRIDDPAALQYMKPVVNLDEFGWWCHMVGCPDHIEEVIYPDGWQQDAPNINAPTKTWQQRKAAKEASK